jgi:spore maturation protein CgeB
MPTTEPLTDDFSLRVQVARRPAAQSPDLRPALDHRDPAVEARAPEADDVLPGEPGTAQQPLKIVMFGFSITSSWGNGHATTYRGLVRELSARGHHVLFLERDAAWFAGNRDLPRPPSGQVALYSSLSQLRHKQAAAVREADLVMLGSYVQDGARLGEWVTQTARGVTAFYDIDTPATISRLAQGTLDCLSESLIRTYDIYFSFTGGPLLKTLEHRYGSPMARPLYCSVDPAFHYPDPGPKRWDLGYMGAYSEDRQPALDELLLEPARNWQRGRFVVAGPQYPRWLRWPRNVKRFTHLPPARHRTFYNAQRFSLNVTRADLVEAGYSPSVRLLEAAACGTPIISDFWEGLDAFFEPQEEILIAHSSEESLYYLLETSEAQRQSLSRRARAKVLAKHTARHRALELESYVREALGVSGKPLDSARCQPLPAPIPTRAHA